jgi:hypothetical protein
MAGKDHDTMRDVLNRLTLKPRHNLSPGVIPGALFMPHGLGRAGRRCPASSAAIVGYDVMLPPF